MENVFAGVIDEPSPDLYSYLLVSQKYPTLTLHATYGAVIHAAFIALILISLSFSVATQPPVDKLIPRSTLFADEDKLNVRLSPDGEAGHAGNGNANGRFILKI